LRFQYKKTKLQEAKDWQLKDLSGVRPTAGWASEVSSTSMASDVELVKRKTGRVQQWLNKFKKSGQQKCHH